MTRLLAPVLILFLVTAGFTQSAPVSRPLDPELANRLQAEPLSPQDFRLAFRLTADGGTIVFTALHPSVEHTEMHMQLRSGQLAIDVLRCDFSAPEFRDLASSSAVQRFCATKPRRARTGVARDRSTGGPPIPNTALLEIKSTDASTVEMIQDVVRALAGKYSQELANER